MTEVPEEIRAEQTESPDRPDPEEYEADQAAGLSPDTGTVYDPSGEPEHTPHDDELEDGAP